MPLAGFTVASKSGVTTTVPADAGILDTHGSYLLVGSGYSLTGVATADLSVASLGSNGVTVVAPDTVGTATDSVGPDEGFHSGTGLTALTDSPSEEYAWVRTVVAGRPIDTFDNAADFQLVSTTSMVGELSTALGSPSPSGTSGPVQLNDVLQSALLDPTLPGSASPNREYTRGTPGKLVIRRTITNTGARTMDTAKLRITAISQLGGGQDPE